MCGPIGKTARTLIFRYIFFHVLKPIFGYKVENIDTDKHMQGRFFALENSRWPNF